MIQMMAVIIGRDPGLAQKALLRGRIVRISKFLVIAFMLYD
jgi:hypothetical protein